VKSPNLQNLEAESEIDKILDDFADVLFDMWLEDNREISDAIIQDNEN
jgi:hypothetical protein